MLSALTADALPGRLAENVVHFARVLRTAGVPVTTDRVMLALDALKVAGLASRADLYATLHCCLVDRAEHRALFDQAFHVFWKDPDLLGQMMRMLLPQVSEKQGGSPPPPPENRRLAEALFKSQREPHDTPPVERVDIDAQMSWSAAEALRKADFDSMTTEEWNAARRLLPQLGALFEPLLTRRCRPAAAGARIDLRALLRASARHGGDIVDLPRQHRRTRPAPLVALVDISGSMSRYSRMFLHFLHALTTGAHAADVRVQSFVFGTRLSHITRPLRRKDPDQAVAEVVRAVDDWSGGTRIAQALALFNRVWARRVLAGSPTVLLVTDGLEHDDLPRLAAEAAHLARSCRRLIWLNPLLRYERFQPRARGVRALLPHVDDFLPVHNIDSLESLARVLAGRGAPSRRTREDTTWN